MNKSILILLLCFLLASCGENKYGVSGGVFTYPHFPPNQVEQTIIKALKCEDCIRTIKAPIGYPIGVPRVLTYEVTYIYRGDLYLKRFHVGKVLTNKEENYNSYLRLIEL